MLHAPVTFRAAFRDLLYGLTARNLQTWLHALCCVAFFLISLSGLYLCCTAFPDMQFLECNALLDFSLLRMCIRVYLEEGFSFTPLFGWWCEPAQTLQRYQLRREEMPQGFYPIFCSAGWTSVITPFVWGMSKSTLPFIISVTAKHRTPQRKPDDTRQTPL